jgi:hypothetical protein
MKLKTTCLPFLTAIAISQPSVAHGLLCPKELTWRDATYAERSTVDSDGRLIRVSVENFQNALLAVVDQADYKAKLLSMKTGATPISLTLGNNRPEPTKFSEIAMAVEPPMGDGNWPRMKRPCDIEDGSVIAFSEKDIRVEPDANTMASPRFHGVLQRQALSFNYVITVEADGAEPSFSYQGSLRYGPPDRAFDLATDMEGWHVYRANSFVRTIPTEGRMPLSAVVNELQANFE